MLTFDKLSIDAELYNQMYDDLIKAIKYTCEIEKCDVEQQVVGILYKIISDSDYRYIIDENGFRENMKKYSPTQFFNLLIEYTELIKDKLLSEVELVNDKYTVDDNLLFALCRKMCNDYIIKRINQLEENNFEEEIVYYGEEPEKVVYYQPSNECWQAIMNGTQTNCRESSFKVANIVGYSNVGYTRSNQEDSYYLGVHPGNNNFKIMAVADGVGGYDKGEVASNLAIRGIIEWFESLNNIYFNGDNNQSLCKSIRDAICQINHYLCTKTTGATTLCMAIIKNDSIVMVNIGDSKGYIIENDKLIYTTYQEDEAHKKGVPESLTRFYKESNLITNYLGGKVGRTPTVNIDVLPLKSNCYYKIIVCSDGVVDCLGDREIVDIVKKGNNNDAKALVERALQNESTLKEELKYFGFFARYRIDREKFNSEIPAGKDNTTAIVGEVSKIR